MYRLILAILVSATALSGLASTGLEEVRAKVRGEYLDAAPSADVALLAAAVDGEGKWPDVDYQDTSNSLWQLEKHLDRLVAMALTAANSPDSIPGLHEAVVRGLRQWFDGGYRNSNWWYTKIGVPRRMLAVAYILDDSIPEDLREKIDVSLNAIDSEDFPARPGGDRIQVLSNHAKVLLWRRDYEGVGEILKKIEGEARIAPYEETMYDAGGGPAVRNAWRPSGRGVQSDFSFHHRGDRVDSTLTYGLELPEFYAYWANLLAGTEWEFSPASTRFIIDYYLDGVSRHLVAGRYAEPSIMNRELSRPGAGKMSPEIAMQLLTVGAGYREDELRENLDILTGCGEFKSEYAADFPESAYFAFARPEFQSAVRYHSQRNANQEAPHNREGIRNHFRGDGACMLSVTGREYADIAPIFDFRMIPGATTPLLPYEPLEAWGQVQVLDPPTRFAGAAADSLYGAVGFDFISPRTDLTARKGYFFFDDGYLCLGSGINSDSPYEIATTIEQSLSPTGEFSQSGDGWFAHCGNAYQVIQGAGEATLEHRSGTWANCVENVEYADDVAEGDLFTLSISHGVGPENGRYAYAVVPRKEMGTDYSFEMITNEPALQAAASKDGKIIYIIFYEPSTLSTPYGDFTSSERCVMMIREGKVTKYVDHE